MLGIILVSDRGFLQDMAALCELRLQEIFHTDTQLGSLHQTTVESQLQALSGYLKRTVTRQPGPVMQIYTASWMNHVRKPK